MKKVLAILMGIAVICVGLFLAYKFVLAELVDPPPEAVMADVIDAAKTWVANDTNANREDFVSHFSTECQARLEREWATQNLDLEDRGSWYELAAGLLNPDETAPEVVGRVDQPAEGEEGEESEEAEVSATVRIIIHRTERDIPFVREDGAWRIDLPNHPQPATRVAAGGE
jgi:hypothetical protein